MKEQLEVARRLIKNDKVFVEFTVTQQGNELHLTKGDESFVRLLPTGTGYLWRIEYFHNEKRWEHIDFSGSLEACLDLLAQSPQYLYWD